MSKPDELTPRQAARLLGVHEDTVRAWAREAIAGQGTRIRRARLDTTRKTPRYYVDGAEVRSLAQRPADGTK